MICQLTSAGAIMLMPWMGVSESMWHAADSDYRPIPTVY